MAQVVEFALANIARVDIVTEETTPQEFTLTNVATEAEATAYISEGQQDTMRVKNVIKAQNNTEDIVLGYDIKLVSATMLPEILALVDGGSLRYDDVETDKIVGYDAPVIGQVVARTPFTLNVFTEEKDASGDIIGYTRFQYLHCKGTPASYTMKEGEFFTPELLCRSRPKSGEMPAKVDFYDELPA